MRKEVLEYLDMDNTFFHFDVRDEKYIEMFGFTPDIGNDSKNAEKTPKVFFSKGIKGVLDIIDVWLIWRMNKDHSESENWIKEFLSESYLEDEEKIEITFNNMYDWLRKRKYYKVDLIEGIDYLENDIDEAKESAILEKQELSKQSKKSWKYLFAYQMYKGKIKHNNSKMEDWNMHTISGKGILPEQISLIETIDGLDDALSVIESLYYQYPNKEEFRLLNSFIKYCEKRNTMSSEVKKV